MFAAVYIKVLTVFTRMLTTFLLSNRVWLVASSSSHGRMLLRAVSARGLSTHTCIATHESDIALHQTANSFR